MNSYEVAFCGPAEKEAKKHLLQHFNQEEFQEDLCFALWRPSAGRSRYTAIIYKTILPVEGDRVLHGNVEFNPSFLSRALNLALEEEAGLAFMHSHPSDGWQGMSGPDIIAERDELASPAQATQLPLLGLTIGTDGYWSARFWKEEKEIKRYWCKKVRVIGEETCELYHNDHIAPAPRRRNILRRTFDTWGVGHQNNIARLKVGIVGLGSVGCIVAEAMARIGVQEIVLIDPDRVEEHNLDRLLYGEAGDIGSYKVSVASRFVEKHATAEKVNVTALPVEIQHRAAYDEALDCDFLFSCVDRPVARDVLNFIAVSHLIPVVDGGISIEVADEGEFSAHWRSQLITPYHQCMRCSKQYTTSDVSVELDGSLDDPSYVSNLPKEQRRGNQNVFPFSLSIASMEVNMMIRYIVSQEWWPKANQQDYQFLNAGIDASDNQCRKSCEFRKERSAMGNRCEPHYIKEEETSRFLMMQMKNKWLGRFTKFFYN